MRHREEFTWLDFFGLFVILVAIAELLWLR